MTDKLGIELAAVESEVDVEVDAVEGSLGGIHALEVLLEILAREVGGQGDDFLDACVREISQLATKMGRAAVAVAVSGRG